MKTNEDYYCTCGHKLKKHDWAGPSIGDEWCNAYDRRPTVREGLKLSWPCRCEKFVPDNLKYLEKKYNERKKK